MRHLTLLRTFESDVVTFGRFENEQRQHLVVTLEEPWIDRDGNGISDRNVSRIPEGTYRAIRRFSPAHQRELFELQGVPGRGNIQIHSGNTTADTLGCIIVGSSIGKLEGKPAVLQSKVAEARFMAELTGQAECMITVIDPPALLELPPPQ